MISLADLFVFVHKEVASPDLVVIGFNSLLHLSNKVILLDASMAKNDTNLNKHKDLIVENPKECKADDKLKALENRGCLQVVLKILSLPAEDSGFPFLLTVFSNQEFIVLFATVLQTQSILDRMEYLVHKEQNENPISEQLKHHKTLWGPSLFVEHTSSESALLT